MKRAMLSLMLLGAALVGVSCGGDAVTDSGESCTPDASLRATAGWQGALFDSHLHLDDRALGRALRCRMQEQDVAEAVLFAELKPGSAGSDEAALRAAAGGTPRRFVPFFYVSPQSPADMEPAKLSQVYSGRESLLRGVGEIGLYRSPWIGTSMSTSPLPDVFRWVDDRDLWIMVHPRIDQLAEARATLGAYPNVKFVMHGIEHTAQWAGVLAQYPNLVLSIDAAGIISQTGQQSLLFSAGSAAAFIAAYDANRDALLQGALQRWTPVIAAAPARVVWGTDVAMGWHTDPQVYRRVIEFSRLFIERLPAEQREPFARGNALRLFGAPTL